MHSPGKSPNRYLLQGSAMAPHVNRDGTTVNTCPNQFTMENVMLVAGIIKQDEKWFGEPDVDVMTLDVIVVYEALKLLAYLDSEGLKTIARGVLMPEPGDKNRQDLIAAIRKAADDAKYKEIWDAEEGLNPDKELELSLDWLTRPGNYKDQFERAIRKAAANDKEGRDLDIENIPPRYRALVTTMLWHTPKLVTRDPEGKKNPLPETRSVNECLRVLADSHADKYEKFEAFDDLNFFYLDQCLMKNFTDIPFTNATARKNLCWRALVNIMAARTALKDEDGMEAEALAAVSERYMLSIAKAMIRDQKNDALMVVIGELEKPIGETAINIAALFKPGGSNKMVFGPSGVIFRQNDDVLNKILYHEWDEAQKRLVRSDSTLSIPIGDVMGIKLAQANSAPSLRP
jgi:hypothetical protein